MKRLLNLPSTFSLQKRNPFPFLSLKTSFSSTKKSSSLNVSQKIKKELSEDLYFDANPIFPKEDSPDVHQKVKERILKLSELEEDERMESIPESEFRLKLTDSVNSIPFDLSNLNIVNIENESLLNKLVPELAHGLENIVFRPGIYTMDEMAKIQPDGGVFLRNIPQVEDVDMSRIPPFIPPSKDPVLKKITQESGIRFMMSTSTISSVLSHFYFLFSLFMSPRFSGIFSEYPLEPKKYMISQRKPVTVVLSYVDREKDIMAVDSDSGLFSFNEPILMNLGKIIERSLTMTPEAFHSALSPESINWQENQIQDDYHRFMILNDEIYLRSQIDCRATDPKTGKQHIFELKTRSVSPIRYDLLNYKKYLDYRLVSHKGRYQSYEREYYDLIRGGFLKYAFQLRIGRMDGALVAYHNTKEIFGFEYISTREIEDKIFGSQEQAEASFLINSKMLTFAIDNVVGYLKSKGEDFEKVKLGFYADNILKKMHIFAEVIPKGQDTDPQVDLSLGIFDPWKYYSTVKSFTNKVYKFDFLVFPFINKTEKTSPYQKLSLGDSYEVRYKFSPAAMPSQNDYFGFLNEAYKLENPPVDMAYSGSWQI